jgi:hypothetical protein
LTERTSKDTGVSATPTGPHIWADGFDRSIKNIFDLQNQVTASVVGAIALKMERGEIERARRKPTEKWMLSITICKAYRYYLQGIPLLSARHTADSSRNEASLRRCTPYLGMRDPRHPAQSVHRIGFRSHVRRPLQRARSRRKII